MKPARLGAWTFSFLLGASCWTAAFGAGASQQGYYRYPSLHRDTLVFAAEGDLWRLQLPSELDAKPLLASRLTTHVGEETHPALSPDGQYVAFVAAYDGARDVYWMPLAGGEPKRLSFDAGRVWVQGFSPDGAVIYTSEAVVGPSWSRVLRKVDPITLAVQQWPLADANEAWLEPDGTLWFTRFGLQVTGDSARDYRGGALAQLWRWRAGETDEAVRVGGREENLQRPMRWRDALIVISDRDGLANLWRMERDGGNPIALTQYTDLEVRAAALSADRIVYQRGADLHALNLLDGRSQILPIRLQSDFDVGRERQLQKPLSYTQSIHLAPDGTRVAVSARGHVALVGTDQRRRVVVSAPEGARIRDAQFMPVPTTSKDSSAAAERNARSAPTLAAIVDIAGRSQLWRFPASGGKGEPWLLGAGVNPADAKHADDAAVDPHLWRIHPAPDGRLLAVQDKLARLRVFGGADHAGYLLDTVEGAGDDPRQNVVWSHDSRYLALAQPETSARRSQIVLISVDGKRRQVLTSDRYESFDPVFSRDGRWLYFLSNRNFVATPSSPWGDRNAGTHFDRRTRVYALALQADTRFPFAAPNELSIGPAAKPDSEAKEQRLPDIEWSGLAERLYEVPVAAGNYRALDADAERLYMMDTDPANETRFVLKALAMNASAQPVVFASGLARYELSLDGKRILLIRPGADPAMPQVPGEILLVDAGGTAPTDFSKAQVRVSDWTLALEPRSEWRQLFLDAWRMHQQFSFDPGMRGVDWQAVRARYEPLVERVTHRAELDDLLVQMSSELGVLHTQVRGAEMPADPEPAAAASLGAMWSSYRQGAVRGVRIDHIYRTDPELPNERAPLQQPGVDARVGDVIVAINAQPVQTPGELMSELRTQVGAQVLLDIRRGERSLQTVVVPVTMERDALLRYGDWVWSRQDRVRQSSGGRIGYLHLRAMGAGDMASFVREFYANIDREGLIIDVRRNRGGNIDSWIIDKLLRRSWAFWQPPLSKPYWNMQQSFRGHLVVLTDELTYSDGETFAAGVKVLGLGPVIGQRTAGAGIWLSDRNRLADFGAARVPEFGQFDAQGRWLIEGKGVSPDLAVENLPYATAMGDDAQLAAALKHLEQRLAAAPVVQPPAQPIPARGTPGHDGSQ